MTQPVLRRADLADLEAAYALDVASFEFPWSKDDFKAALLARTPFIVMELKGRIVGQCVYRTVLDEGEILTFCIHPDCQGKGYGAELLEYVLALAALAGVREVFLEVRVGNARARRLYAKAGFEEIAIRKDYYMTRTGREDAVVMKRIL